MKIVKLKQIALLLSLLVFSSSALAQIIPITTDSRIKTLVYNPNEVYELKFFYGYQSFIEFSDSEEIETISLGEAFAWRITPSGKRLFIRPLEIAAHTNMTIITSKRTYHFDIKSGEFDGKADEELVYTVRFYYPQIGQPLPIPPQLASAAPPPPQALAVNKRTVFQTFSGQGRIDESKNQKNILKIGGNPEGFELNFNYSMAGKSNAILPLKVYDNGRETFMQFKDNNAIIPNISAVDDFGGEYPLNYIIKDNYVVLPAVSRQFTLRRNNDLLCIYNNQAIGR